jgi:hypothetical protein
MWTVTAKNKRLDITEKYHSQPRPYNQTYPKLTDDHTRQKWDNPAHK